MSHVRDQFFVGSVALLAATVLIIVTVIPGCGSRGGAETFPVQLKVSFVDGGVPEGAVVALQPDSQTDKSYSATGKVQADGTCELSTFKQGDGAVAGRYFVTVAPAPTMPGVAGPKPAAIHPRFRDKNTSGLGLTITPDPAKNQFTLQIERPGN